jgi:hypothetical protein
MGGKPGRSRRAPADREFDIFDPFGNQVGDGSFIADRPPVIGDRFAARVKWERGYDPVGAQVYWAAMAPVVLFRCRLIGLRLSGSGVNTATFEWLPD